MAAQAGGRFHRGTSMCSKSPLIRGRMFTDRDDGSAPGVVLINEGLAKQFWPNSDPVGQRITIGKGVGPEFEEPPREIIGIVGDVRKMIVRQGMALALAGVFIGVAAALGLTRLMASLLYGVTARDPIAMTSVALLLIGVALAATYIPARRASRVDPVVSLRYE